jgi:transcriptional antiterminator RfaH
MAVLSANRVREIYEDLASGRLDRLSEIVDDKIDAFLRRTPRRRAHRMVFADAGAQYRVHARRRACPGRPPNPRRGARAPGCLRSPASLLCAAGHPPPRRRAHQRPPALSAPATGGARMTFWACAQAETKREAVAAHFLKLAKFEVYVPQVRERKIRRRRRVEIISPLFPSYIFIVIESQWHAARWSIGVAGIIMDGTSPAKVPDQVIEQIRQREIKGAIELPKPPGMRAGDRVRISGGLLEGQFGLYADMRSRERVEVLLNLLGSQQRVTLPSSNVAAI